MNDRYDYSVAKPKCLMNPIIVPVVKLIGPGPTNMTPRIKRALDNCTIGPMDDPFLKIMDEIQEGLQYIFQTTSPYVFCLPGVGHSGIEATICNLLEPEESIIICVNGVWGERAMEVANRQGLKVHEINASIGKIFKKEDIKNALEKYRPTALFITHIESSTCVLQDIEEIGHLCHRYGTFFIVDAVASVIVTPFFMDKWGIDVTYTATQKALSTPAGLAPIALSINAMNKIKARKVKPTTFYLDIVSIANYWNCDNGVRGYHHTCPVNIAYALRESLAEIVTKGLEWHWKRQLRVRDFFIKGLEKLGYKLFITDKELRAPLLTSVVIPNGIEWRKVMRHLAEHYDLQLLGGLGPSMGLIFRIGFIGPNCDEKLVQYALESFHATIQKQMTRSIL